MAKKKQIQAKPTTIDGVTYRSRLEARWAIFLKQYHACTRFTYEAVKLPSGYTPDFIIETATPALYVLEVKPTYPNEEYIKYLKQQKQYLKGTLLLAYGSFYQNEEPQLQAIRTKRLSAAKTIGDIFLMPNTAINAAKSHRFDL